MKVCGGHLQPVLDTILAMRDAGVWIELTNLVIPGVNDDMDMIRQMCRWIVDKGLADQPLHFSRFFPRFKMQDIPPTPVQTLKAAKQIAEEHFCSWYKHPTDYLRHHVGLDKVASEGCAYRLITFLPAREVGLGKLRPLSADRSIDSEYDASVCLFKIQRQRITCYQDAIALLVRQECRIDTTVITFKVKVVHVLCPEAIAIGLMATRITGKGTVSNPLHPVDAGIEQIGQS